VTLDGLIARGRAAAEALMTDTGYVRRAGTPTTNETTGVVTPTWTDIYASSGTPGPLRVQQGIGATDAQAGEHQSQVAGLVISLPITEADVRPGDQVVVSTSTYDPALVGRVFTVSRVLAKSHATARRLWCEEVQA